MSDYDSTNSGVIFEPHQDQKFTGQGKLNANGRDLKLVMVYEKISKDKPPMLVLYQRLGPLFVNDKKGNDKAPDFSGPMDGFPDWRMAAWKGMKDGRKYMSLKASPKQSAGDGGAGQHAQTNGASAPAPGPSWDDDEIPF